MFVQYCECNGGSVSFRKIACIILVLDNVNIFIFWSFIVIFEGKETAMKGVARAVLQRPFFPCGVGSLQRLTDIAPRLFSQLE